MKRGMRRSSLAALAIVVVSIAGAAVPFAHGASHGPATDDSIDYWDGPTYNLTWSGQQREVISDSFLADPVVVPGDDIHRTLRIHNSGQGACDDADITVRVIDVDQAVPAGAVNSELEDLVELYWTADGKSGKISFAKAREKGEFQLARFTLPRGQDSAVEVGYRFPESATGGRSLGQDSVIESFRVNITARDVCATDEPEPTPTPDPNDPFGFKTGGLFIGGQSLLIGSLMLGLVMLFCAALVRSRQTERQRRRVTGSTRNTASREPRPDRSTRSSTESH
jgi:hypothetical protein